MMKKKITIFNLVLLIGVVLCISKSYAQNYLINFEATGITTTLDSVYAENFNQGLTLLLNGTDSLHLIGPDGITNIYEKKGTITVFPNPMQGKAEIKFYTNETSNVQLFIYDINGKVVVKTEALLTKGTHKYQDSGLQQGMYFINIIGDKYVYTTKLISQNTSPGEARLFYLGNEEAGTSYNLYKSTNAILDMTYNSCDNLFFKGYSGIFSSTVTDIPNSSKQCDMRRKLELSIYYQFN